VKTKALGMIVLAGCASATEAQMLAFRTTGALIRELQQRSIIPSQDNGNPLQPTGFGKEELGKTGKIPEPETDDKALQIIKVGSYKQGNGDLEMTGGVEFLFHGYHIFADSAEGNLSNNIFSLKGEVKLIGKDAVVTGSQITVDFDNRVYHSFDSQSDLKPSLIQGAFIKDLYAHGKESYGSANENQTLYGGITSCDLLRPHYEIDGDNIIVRPGKRAIFRKARIRLFGRTILKLDYLSIPLDDRSYNNTPEVGQSQQEGYFIKTRFGVATPGNGDLYSRLDYMSKLGVGIGADWLYKNQVMNGRLDVYTIVGPGDMVKISDEHQQKFKWGTLVVDSDYENNNYLVQPGAVIQSEKALLTFPQHNGAITKVSLSESASSTGSTSTTTDLIGISDNRKFGKDITTAFDVNYQSSGTSYQNTSGPVTTNTTTTQQSLSVKGDIQDDLTKATAELEYQRQIPIGSTLAFYGSNDVTPELSLSSDAKRLMGNSFAANWPFKTSLSIGEFSDELTNGTVTRDAFDLKFQHPDHSTGLFHSDISGEFRQGIYSDGTAQYVLDFADGESYKLDKNTSFNFHYNYMRPYGYSPVSIDETGRQNAATADLSVKVLKTLSIGAQSGYDLIRLEENEAAWQPVGVRMEWQPKDYLLMRTQAMYDTLSGAWSNIRIDTSYKPGATYLSVGSYYDGIRHTWENANLFLDNLTWGKTKLSAILTYNGYTQQFDNEQFSVTYDLHCAEAVFTYQVQNNGFEPGRTMTFMIRLKALPFSSPFGAGSRGQPLGTGTGTSF
jgi:LPS-assembly protein